MKNITITLPEDVARWLRVRAAEDDRSVSRWIRELLERKRDREDDYEVAMKRYLARKPRKIDWAGVGHPGTNCMSALVFVDTDVWEAVIVAAAQSRGCSILLTEDLQHGYGFGEVRVVDPFRSRELAPAEVVGRQA